LLYKCRILPHTLYNKIWKQGQYIFQSKCNLLLIFADYTDSMKVCITQPTLFVASLLQAIHKSKDFSPSLVSTIDFSFVQNNSRMTPAVTLLLSILLSGLLCILGQNPHPLDPLTSDELRLTVSILERAKPILKLQENFIYRSISLLEPEKELLLDSFLNGTPAPWIPRKARVILVERQTDSAFVAIANLNSQLVERWTPLSSSYNTGVTDEEYEIGFQAALNDPQVRARCQEMGWTNMSLVVGDMWAYAYIDDKPGLVGAVKPAQLYMYGQVIPEDNHYGWKLLNFKIFHCFY